MKRFPVLCKFVPDNIINPKMSTLERIIRDYDKDIVLKDCQRKAFEYLLNKNLITCLELLFRRLQRLRAASTDNSV